MVKIYAILLAIVLLGGTVFFQYQKSQKNTSDPINLKSSTPTQAVKNSGPLSMESFTPQTPDIQLMKNKNDIDQAIEDLDKSIAELDEIIKEAKKNQ